MTAKALPERADAAARTAGEAALRLCVSDRNLAVITLTNGDIATGGRGVRGAP